MEFAIWNGERISASEVAYDYEMDRDIHKASGRRELRCCDTECRDPIIKYCHGEVKEPYFSHIHNEECDYARYDKENIGITKTIKKSIYDHFKTNYDVDFEIKIIPHHYTPIVFNMGDERRIAIEIGSKNTSANRIDFLMSQYSKIKVKCKWIVIGNIGYFNEESTYIMKRYVLNESKNKELIMIDEEGKQFSQFRMDSNSRQMYSEKATIKDLVLNNEDITIKGYCERYDKWLANKKEEYYKRIKLIEQGKEEEKQTEGKRKQYQIPFPNSLGISNYKHKNITEKKEEIRSEDYYRQEIMAKIDQQETQARDSLDRRWLKCEICGRIGRDKDFNRYGQQGMNLGVCDNCK